MKTFKDSLLTHQRMNFDTCETRNSKVKDMHMGTSLQTHVQDTVIYCCIHRTYNPSLYKKDIELHQRSALQFHPMCATSQLLALHGLTEEE